MLSVIAWVYLVKLLSKIFGLLCGMCSTGYAVRYDNVPGSLRDFGKIANHNFKIWFTRHGVLKAFARGVLSGPTDLRIVTAELPDQYHTAQVCWRLLDLLESITDGRQQ